MNDVELSTETEKQQLISYVFIFNVTRYNKLWQNWGNRRFQWQSVAFSSSLRQNSESWENSMLIFTFESLLELNIFQQHFHKFGIFWTFLRIFFRDFQKIRNRRNSKIRWETGKFRRIWRIFENVGDLESGERTIQKVSRKIKTKSPVLVVSLQYL